MYVCMWLVANVEAKTEEMFVELDEYTCVVQRDSSVRCLQAHERSSNALIRRRQKYLDMLTPAT